LSSRDYHFGELAIAQDPTHPSHILPPPLPAHASVLDVGCGAGQTLISAYPHNCCVGIDIDLEALQLGRGWNSSASFLCASAENVPLAPASFDAVIARVSLAYTDLSRSLPEIRRVLKPGGHLWIVLHPAAIPWHTARHGGPRAWLYFAYIAANSALFHLTGRMFRFFGRCESFQTSGGITRALRAAGFQRISIERSRHFVVTARL
jgi:SAM-dependent methyltransferase